MKAVRECDSCELIVGRQLDFLVGLMEIFEEEEEEMVEGFFPKSLLLFTPDGISRSLKIRLKLKMV